MKRQDDIDRNSDNVCGFFSLNDSIKFNIKMCINQDLFMTIFNTMLKI